MLLLVLIYSSCFPPPTPLANAWATLHNTYTLLPCFTTHYLCHSTRCCCSIRLSLFFPFLIFHFLFLPWDWFISKITINFLQNHQNRLSWLSANWWFTSIVTTQDKSVKGIKEIKVNYYTWINHKEGIPKPAVRLDNSLAEPFVVHVSESVSAQLVS